MHRRELLRAGAAASLLALARRAHADMMAPERPMAQVFAGVSAGGAQVPGSVLDLRPGGARDFVKLDADLGAHAAHVFSIDNANDRFVAWVMILPVPKGTWAYLLFDGEVRAAASIGEDAGAHSATFELDAAFAKRVAQAWGTTVNIRLPLDGGLSYAWSNPGAAARGKPVRIALRVSNQGPRAVRIDGSAGPRDHRFSFRVRRADGRELATREVMVIDELTAIERIAAGEHVDLEVDLREWIATAGTYDVDCAFDGAITDDTDDAGRWPAHGAETWDVAARGALRVIIP